METTLFVVSEQTPMVQEKEKSPKWFEQFIEDFDYQGPRRGQVLDGKIVHIDEDTIIVDVGLKRDAIVPVKDLSKVDDEILTNLSVGDDVPVYVTQTPVGDHDLIVSLNRGIEYENWDKAEDLLAEGTLLDLDVIGENRGGVLVQFESLQGFIPNTHLPALKRVRDHQKTRDIKKEMLGSTLTVKTIEVDRDKRRLIFSSREALAEQRHQRLLELEKGQIIQGKVVNVVDFGVFVDLNGVDGLVHKSKLEWEGTSRPADLFKVNDEIEVKVIDVNVERERISLSRKALLPNPWETLKNEYHIGDVIKGVVTDVVNFGAFVKLPVGVQGLIHISELGYYSSEDPHNVVRPGETILVRIIDIDAKRERVSLSMRQVPIEQQIDWMADRWQDKLME